MYYMHQLFPNWHPELFKWGAYNLNLVLGSHFWRIVWSQETRGCVHCSCNGPGSLQIIYWSPSFQRSTFLTHSEILSLRIGNEDLDCHQFTTDSVQLSWSQIAGWLYLVLLLSWRDWQMGMIIQLVWSDLAVPDACYKIFLAACGCRVMDHNVVQLISVCLSYAALVELGYFSYPTISIGMCFLHNYLAFNFLFAWEILCELFLQCLQVLLHSMIAFEAGIKLLWNSEWDICKYLYQCNV